MALTMLAYLYSLAILDRYHLIFGLLLLITTTPPPTTTPPTSTTTTTPPTSTTTTSVHDAITNDAVDGNKESRQKKTLTPPTPPRTPSNSSSTKPSASMESTLTLNHLDSAHQLKSLISSTSTFTVSPADLTDMVVRLITRLHPYDRASPPAPHWTPLVSSSSSSSSPSPDLVIHQNPVQKFNFRIWGSLGCARPERAFRFLTDIEARPHWDDLVEHTRILSVLSDSSTIPPTAAAAAAGQGGATGERRVGRTRVVYIRMKPVWPTKARDLVLLSHITKVRITPTSKSKSDLAGGDGSSGMKIEVLDDQDPFMPIDVLSSTSSSSSSSSPSSPSSQQRQRKEEESEGEGDVWWVNVTKSIDWPSMPPLDNEGIVRMSVPLSGQILRHFPSSPSSSSRVGEGRTELVQLLDGDPGGWIPSSVVSLIANTMMPRSFRKLDKLVSELCSHDNDDDDDDDDNNNENNEQECVECVDEGTEMADLMEMHRVDAEVSGVETVKSEPGGYAVQNLMEKATPWMVAVLLGITVSKLMIQMRK